MGRTVRDALAFTASTGRVADIDPAGRPVEPDEKLGKALDRSTSRLAKWQERLWAASTAGGRDRVLLVLQGIDTSGKGGVTEHVVGACGPIGVQYTAFKKPTPTELRHDFLWRIRKRVPPPGIIGVFDRSHYEDVLVVRVHDLVPPDVWGARYEQINAFERELTNAGTTIIKCLLHVSYDEQRQRLLARLDDPEKQWKFNPADIDERGHWQDYQDAFQAAVEKCDSPRAPWYVVPSDSKKYRNWAISELLRETLAELAPAYPPPDFDPAEERARLG